MIDREVADTVDDEALADAERRDDHSADRRADRAGRVDDDAVEGDGVADVGWPDHLHDEGLAARVVEGGDAAETDGERVDHPEFDDAGRG